MARQQQTVLVEDLVRQEESLFLDRMGEFDAQRSAEGNAEQEIEDGIDRMRETVIATYPDIALQKLNLMLRETRLTLRRKAGLEAPTHEEIFRKRIAQKDRKEIIKIIAAIILIALCPAGFLIMISSSFGTTVASPNQKRMDETF